MSSTGAPLPLFTRYILRIRTMIIILHMYHNALSTPTPMDETESAP